MILTARVILGLLIFGMFIVHQLSRFNINIAIVAITHTESKDNNTISKFDDKAILLGSIFYMAWVTELMSAHLLARFGCRYLMTTTFGLNAVACFLFPWTYRLHPLCAVVVRIIQGMALSTTSPAMLWLAASWIPKNERSRFMSAFHGVAIGASFSNLFGGIAIEKFGWPYIFYGTGILSIIWILFWWSYGYDSPSVHPRISKEELVYLKENVETNKNPKCRKSSRPTPWLDILTSLPFWSIVLMTFSLPWFIITLAMQMPTYFDMVHGLNIKTNGLLLSIPDILKAVVGIFFSTFVDNLIKKNKITVLTARKLSIGIGNILPSIAVIFLGYFGYTSITLSATLIILSSAINGAGTSSIFANIIDISPNHASAMIGVIQIVANLPGIISPIIFKYILDKNGDWGTSFLIPSLILLASTIFFLTFMSSDIQSWNNKDIVEDIHKNLDMIDKLENASTAIHMKNSLKGLDENAEGRKCAT